MRRSDSPVQPAWVRVWHWLNALAVLVMVLSGWRIYNASPIYPFRFPDEITLGGWLAGAVQWHFAAMWLLGLNLVVYLVLNLVGGRGLRRFWPLTPHAVLTDFMAALRGRLVHADPAHYNAVQKLAYLTVLADLVLLIVSGLVIWKPVQFPLLRMLLGDFDNARVVHFWAMALLLAFVAVHLVMVAVVPRTLKTMVTGRA
ncbi:MAG TPA: cytochrome b/b6 domain-containing protein [Burkholderiaceae bacterium]|nr:cytochrome b/b6 domain-containing protein [Burkholderiaceae bacterium]